MNIWFTSDTHYGHTNIAGPIISNWASGFRDFNSVYEMNKTIVENINEYVKEDDILYHLGDWSFGGVHNILEFRRQLICKNVHIILGNHDQHLVNKEIRYYDGTFNPINIFSSIKDVDILNIGKIRLFLSHYSHRVWPGSHRGVIHLYGHSHNSIEGFGKSMDVGLDSAYQYFGEYRPFGLDDILDIMRSKETPKVDHHE